MFPDLHNHTSRCGHASGTLQEYAEAALKAGTAWLGFADHAPVPEAMRPGESMAPEETEAYIQDLFRLRDQYAGRLEILTGFEVDFPLLGSFDSSYFTDDRLDYLIGSCHYLDGWGFDNPDYTDGFSSRDINGLYTEYYSVIERLIDSRLFNIAGHIDLLKKFGHRPSADFSSVLKRLGRKLVSSGMAFEVNTSGWLKPVQEQYPSEDIINLFFECSVPVTLGSDSHSPEQNGYGLARAAEILRKAGYRKLTVFRKRRPFEIQL